VIQHDRCVKSLNELHEAAKDLFGVIIDFGAGETNARAIQCSPGTPFQLNKFDLYVGLY